MSKRKSAIKEPSELSNEPEPKRKGWNEQDKMNLLAALKKYGHTDIDNISTMLPDKTKPAIKLMIHKIMQKAKLLSPGKNTPLDTWLKSKMFNDEAPPIPEALKFIAMFEEHPSPAESAGFDFRAAYNYLHQMTLGQPAIDVPEETLKKLNELIDEVKEEVRPDAEIDAITYLGKLDKKKHVTKCYRPMSRLRWSKNEEWKGEEAENEAEETGS